MRRIAVVTGSRADFCPLKYVIEQLVEQCYHIELKGMYGQEAATRTILHAAACKPDMAVLLGDRYETLIAASVLAEMAIPIVHIGGGEQTLGSTDEQFRHAISKLAFYHFTAHQDFADKVIGMGEDPTRVFVTGDPQVDGLVLEPLIDTRPPYVFALISYHPETLGGDAANLKIIVDKISKYDGAFIVGANADKGSYSINQFWKLYKKKNWHFEHKYSHHEWLHLLKQADALIGNSSSFCIEGMTYYQGMNGGWQKIIMIGDRQKGRWEQAQKHFAADKFAYGEPGKVSQKIVELLMALPIPEKPRKPFYS